MAIDRLRVNEGSSKVIEFDILDEAGVGVSEAALSTATLTLVDLETYVPDASPAQGILNTRDVQDVLNDNDVVIDSDGHVIWTMQPDDNAIVTPRRQVERHRAAFGFTWSGGAFRYEFEVDVLNLRSAS